MKERYTEAQDFAEMALKHLVQNGQLQKTALYPTEVLFSLVLPVINGTDDKGPFYRCADGALTWLVVNAKTDRGAYNLSRQIVTSRLLRNEPLPDKAREFAGFLLADVIDPPKAQRAAQTFATNVMLYWTAKIIESDYGLKLTRGDNNEAISACDAVSDALKRLNHAKSYKAIRDLCHHRTALPMRQMAHQIREIMEKVSAENSEMLVYWQSQAPWGSTTE